MASRTPSRGQVDLDQRIHELLAKESKLRQTIQDLELALCSSQRELKETSEQLARLHALKQSRPGPIHKCPPEILALILRTTISSPELAPRYMRVCRKWRDHIENDPCVWNTIELRYKWGDWDVLSWSQSALAYVEACVRRSQSALPNISLDFSLIGDLDRQLSFRVMDGLSMTAGDGIDWSTLWEWAVGLSFDELTTMGDLVDKCDPELSLEPMQALVGPQGSVMKRWGQLTVSFPMCETIMTKMWRMLRYPTPSLSKLHVYGSFVTPTIPAFPDLSNLTKLLFPDLTDWKFISLNPRMVEDLRYPDCPEEEAMAPWIHLPEFLNLRCLNLTSWPTPSRDDLPIRIHLPSMESLSLLDSIPEADKVEFIVPKLDCLTLNFSPRIDKLHLDIPKLYPRCLKWRLPWFQDDVSEDDCQELVLATILPLMKYFKTADTMHLVGRGGSLLLSSFHKSYILGKLDVPNNFKRLSYLPPDGKGETITIDEGSAPPTMTRSTNDNAADTH